MLSLEVDGGVNGGVGASPIVWQGSPWNIKITGTPGTPGIWIWLIYVRGGLTRDYVQCAVADPAVACLLFLLGRFRSTRPGL